MVVKALFPGLELIAKMCWGQALVLPTVCSESKCWLSLGGPSDPEFFKVREGSVEMSP